MKHEIKATVIVVVMFLIAQLVGLAIISLYTPIIIQEEVDGEVINITKNPVPYGVEPPPESKSEFSFISIILAFLIAIALVALLTKLKAAFFLKTWFFVVVTLVLSISINAFLYRVIPHSATILSTSVNYSEIIAMAIALPLAIFKIYKRNLYVHNLTELLIYPGIAVIFVPLLTVTSIVILLVIISIYDMWAVWHSGFMQKMAKYQMDELKVFAGFFVPYLSKEQRMSLKNTKKGKNKKGMKVNVAILGGGDVVFPIITAGVILRASSLLPALIVALFSVIALIGLLLFAKKKKFYPAMPFISAGLFAGILVVKIIGLI
jgi:presenilin-like A22 family membrane protease